MWHVNLRTKEEEYPISGQRGETVSHLGMKKRNCTHLGMKKRNCIPSRDEEEKLYLISG
jgi:hypothetical protein